MNRAKAQDRVRRIGLLLTTPTYKEPLETTLKERGWNLGSDLLIEYRFSGGNTVLGRRAAAIADFRKAQSLDPTDRLSKQQLHVLE